MKFKSHFLSKNKKENFPIAGINIPAKVVSGDFYNFSDLGNGMYGFGVADVSGKGIKSSLLMSKASSLYRCLSKTDFSSANLLMQLNNEILKLFQEECLLRCWLGFMIVIIKNYYSQKCRSRTSSFDLFKRWLFFKFY